MTPSRAPQPRQLKTCFRMLMLSDRGRGPGAAIDPADELDPSPLRFVFNAHGASALDQVAGDHRCGP